MHLHYESLELETRIDSCNAALQTHVYEVESREQLMRKAVKKQVNRHKKESHLTNDELRMIKQIGKLLLAPPGSILSTTATTEKLNGTTNGTADTQHALQNQEEWSHNAHVRNSRAPIAASYESIHTRLDVEFN